MQLNLDMFDFLNWKLSTFFFGPLIKNMNFN